MANREACEVYIEQEIVAGLKKGKKPWTIGKELSAWVEKLFEVTINPKTIASRANRVSSNEEKKSKPTENIEYSKPEIIEDRKPQGGGARKNAGRKRNIEVTKEIVETIKSLKDQKKAIEENKREYYNDPRNKAKEKVNYVAGLLQGSINTVEGLGSEKEVFEAFIDLFGKNNMKIFNQIKNALTALKKGKQYD